VHYAEAGARLQVPGSSGTPSLVKWRGKSVPGEPGTHNGYGTSWITPQATRAPALPAGCVA
jgi:hypothetical protein